MAKSIGRISSINIDSDGKANIHYEVESEGVKGNGFIEYTSATVTKLLAEALTQAKTQEGIS